MGWDGHSCGSNKDFGTTVRAGLVVGIADCGPACCSWTLLVGIALDVPLLAATSTELLDTGPIQALLPKHDNPQLSFTCSPYRRLRARSSVPSLLLANSEPKRTWDVLARSLLKDASDPIANLLERSSQLLPPISRDPRAFSTTPCFCGLPIFSAAIETPLSSLQGISERYRRELGRTHASPSPPAAGAEAGAEVGAVGGAAAEGAVASVWGDLSEREVSKLFGRSNEDLHVVAEQSSKQEWA